MEGRSREGKSAMLNEVDVAQRLAVIERDLRDDEPDLVHAFEALSHPSLRGRSLAVATRSVYDYAAEERRVRSAVALLTVFCGLLLVAIGVITGSFAALLSAVSLVVATTAIVGLLAVVADLGATPYRRRR